MAKSTGLAAGHKSADGVASKGKTRTKKLAFGGLGQAIGNIKGNMPSMGGKAAPTVGLGQAMGGRGPMPPVPIQDPSGGRGVVGPGVGNLMRPPPAGDTMGIGEALGKMPGSAAALQRLGGLGGGGAPGPSTSGIGLGQAMTGGAPLNQVAALQRLGNLGPAIGGNLAGMAMKKGGAVKKMAKGGGVRAKGEHPIQKKGHTRGKMVGMKKGGMCK